MNDAPDTTPNPEELPIDHPSRRRLPVLLRNAWFGFDQAFRRRIKHMGISPGEYDVLRWLLEGDPEGMTQREIQHLMSSDPNTMTSLLRRMARAGLIRRYPHEEDARAYRVLISDKGREKYEQARGIAVKLQTQAINALPEDKREAFLADLEVIARACDQLLQEAFRDVPVRKKPVPRRR